MYIYVYIIHGFLAACENAGKSKDPVPRKHSDRRQDQRTDRPYFLGTNAVDWHLKVKDASQSMCRKSTLNSCTHFQDTANLGSHELNKRSRPYLTTGTQKSVKQLLAFLNFRLPRTSYRFLAPCQHLEKTNNTILKNVQTGRSTDGRMEERTEGPKSFISQFL